MDNHKFLQIDQFRRRPQVESIHIVVECDMHLVYVLQRYNIMQMLYFLCHCVINTCFNDNFLMQIIIINRIMVIDCMKLSKYFKFSKKFIECTDFIKLLIAVFLEHAFLLHALFSDTNQKKNRQHFIYLKIKGHQTLC